MTSTSNGLRDGSEVLRRRGLLLLWFAAPLLLAQAFLPTDQFIHRGDDAFYYFGLAANYPEVGFWTFDRIHPSNGVQPVWAILLTGVAEVLHWVGVTDKAILSRVFVALAAIVHFASCLLLFHILARTVSIGTAIASAGAFLFSMGIVWQRVWGMENALFALMLLSTVAYFHFVHLVRPRTRTALVLGLLLGLTALTRLNAGFFVACLLVHYVLLGRHGKFGERMRLGAVAAVVAAVLIGGYLLHNLSTTGHLLPVSGAVKQFEAERFLASRGFDSMFNFDAWTGLYWHLRSRIFWFITSHGVDGFWIAGSRLIFSQNSAIPIGLFWILCAGFALIPALLGRPLEWARFLRTRLGALAPFGYVLAFGVTDALVSLSLYPSQLSYAMIRWWFVENEIVVTVVTATLAVAALAYVGARLFDARRQTLIATLALAGLVAYHVQEMPRFYWSGVKTHHDWNLSWNDESYRAAVWISENLPQDTIVGSWNAGVVGYYSDQRVVNLDGLINNYELLPYLLEGRIGDYILEQGVEYISDMQGSIKAEGALDQLELETVYSHHSRFLREDYRIYRVLGRRP
ncbi:MAG: hypothetical protein CMJ98_10880 [Planctomycetes bacterium]|jgi:hypothetical protein|nr:hypothetical protein [Planctomycetota bacterium]HJM57903.1 hypothetical protein [Planctomycetota bacterium]